MHDYNCRCSLTHIDLIAQLRVQVYDDANPAERAETRVIINVQRNVNAPVFKQATYEATIVENYPIGGSVLQVGLALCVVHAFVVDDNLVSAPKP